MPAKTSKTQETPMYMSQHRFTPVPEKLEQWIAYNRNYMSLTAAAPGAVVSRILQIEDDPSSYFAVGIWTDKDSAVRWTDSPESKRGAQPSQDLGLYEGYPMIWSRWNLIDFRWGAAGLSATPASGGHVRHVVQDTPPLVTDMIQLARINRAILQILSALPGFVSGEIYQSHRNDRFLNVLTFTERAANPFEAGLPGGLQTLWNGIPASVQMEIENCSIFQCIWGPEAGGLDAFAEAAA